MIVDGRYSNTMYTDAEMLNHGIGVAVAVDYKEVIEYFKIVISRKFQLQCMNMLNNSQGADVNYGEALKYSITVIDGGFQPTMRNYKLLLQTIRRSAKKPKLYQG